MSDLHSLLGSLSLSEHQAKFGGATLEEVVALEEGELKDLLDELKLSALERAKLRRAVLALKETGRGGASKSELVERGYEQFFHHEHAAALATFRECAGSCVALGYQAVVLWVGGGGVDKDVEGAKQAATKALDGGLRGKAEKGDHHAQFVLGAMYSHGIGVYENKAKAAVLFSKAADQENAAAQYCLGACYKFGEGADRDSEQAKFYFRLAAAQGSDRAKATLSADAVVQRGYEQLVHQHHAAALAAFRESKDGCVALGFQAVVLLLQGGHAEAAKQAATQAVAGGLRDEAARGDNLAQFVLGFLHRRGVGVDKDNNKATALLTLAAEQGNLMAQKKLGYNFYHGEGVAKDMDKALHFYRLAAAQGDVEAKRFLE